MRLLIVGIGSLLLIFPSLACGQDSHVLKVDGIQEDLIQKARAILASADTVDAALATYQSRSAATDDARATVKAMAASELVWRDLATRDTRRRTEAKAKLEDMLARARASLAIAQRHLSAFELAERRAWAAAHPDEAAKRMQRSTIISTDDDAAPGVTSIGGVTELRDARKLMNKLGPGSGAYIQNGQVVISGAKSEQLRDDYSLEQERRRAERATGQRIRVGERVRLSPDTDPEAWRAARDYNRAVDDYDSKRAQHDNTPRRNYPDF